MDKQLANPIPENQLLNEVREIYDELVIAERECINVVDIVSQIDQTAGLSDEQWSLCTSLHQTLLHKHFDFFIVSQHPAASPILRSLAQRYEMPGRMWRYGIYSYLELFRTRLPSPSVQDHMLGFIYFSYSMVTLLLEQVSTFEEIWTECLGDLARYRAAVENSDETVRHHWHYLAVISRPDTLQMFFYFSEALLSVDRFPKARESMIQLFNDILIAPAEEHTLISSFAAAHGVIFKRMPYDQFVIRFHFFLLKNHHSRSPSLPEARESTLIMCCNIAAILDYGEGNGEFATDFAHNASTSTADAYIIAKYWASATAHIESNRHVYTVQYLELCTLYFSIFY
ncbi:DNA/RNA-binding domain E.t1.c1-type [Penicillium nucicola]|uniref:DNA/RNA-binding domain E.t1.c1-type n=1 Tax=Penicillium nucicola TaxID=1850975 RepID=UPI0025459485|nr:DNA/RNA-binding domain E.t1.c1-type [Penicillium nucicola]KAJ5776714.1 DNA/RNA-binding domain E.t1.c1-type [Penicillium nucicola]